MIHSMKYPLTLLFTLTMLISNGQDQRISTFEFVEILANNREEAVYYFENNWKVLREMALERDYLVSYDLLETNYADDTPFHLVLQTTYANQEQFAQREERFSLLISELGALNLLNELKPADFRASVFVIESAVSLR